jgi:lipoprotein-anchoring transpeptidase ErfK/SrfK
MFYSGYFDVRPPLLLSANRYRIVSIRLLLPGLLAAVVVGGCGAGAAPTRHAVAAKRVQRCAPGTYESTSSPRLAYAAVVIHHAVAQRRPGARVMARFGRLNRNELPMVFGVRGALLGSTCKPAWYRVQLPIRPNGSVGWVRASAVSIAPIRTRIVVDISARRLTLFRDGRPVLTSRVAVGAVGTPTPEGSFYVNQRLIPSDPTGPYGPAAVGVSAFSNVLTGWAQGGPIGIHGTNEPWSIGHTDSNGCIRLPNPVVRRLFRQVFAGTPVIIHP